MNPEHSQPVDLTAAKVTRFPGVRADPLPAYAGDAADRNARDLARGLSQGFSLPPRESRDWRGFTFGALSVVGYLGPGGAKGARWAVRCKCGAHEVRTGSALGRMERRETAEGEALCHQCTRLRNWREGKRTP